jgi:hypothetical protein
MVFKLVPIVCKLAPAIFGTKYVVSLPENIASTINLELAADSVANDRDISVTLENASVVLYNRSRALVPEPDTDALTNK